MNEALYVLFQEKKNMVYTISTSLALETVGWMKIIIRLTTASETTSHANLNNDETYRQAVNM